MKGGLPDPRRIWQDFKARYGALPGGLKDYLRRCGRLLLWIPLGALMGLPVVGGESCGLFFILAEGGLVLGLLLRIRKFFRGDYLEIAGEILKIEGQGRLKGLFGGRRVLYVKDGAGFTLSLALSPREARSFSVGERVVICGTGGHFNRFGVFELWGYYAVCLEGRV
ncbi:MAG: hypothetical protein Q4C55_09035 [Eubacterium sp.]|nr:hypothetical protein [Eubacterium sp.]